MTRFLDDRCLKNFMATYESRNLRQAAEIVGLTQPAMSKSLARLESDLGIPLFGRLSKGLSPTPAAHELYDCARRIDAETRRSLARIAGIENNLQSEIRIGAGTMWSWIKMPGVIQSILQAFPMMQVNLLTAPMRLLMDELESDNIDIAVGETTDLQIPKGFQEYKFEPSLQWPFTRPSHPLANRENVSLADVVKFPWIGFFNNSAFNRSVAKACEAEGLDLPLIPVRTTSLAATMALARDGDYVVVLPHEFSDVAAHFNLSRLKSRSVKMWKMKTSIVCHTEHIDSMALKAVIDMMRAESKRPVTTKETDSVG